MHELLRQLIRNLIGGAVDDLEFDGVHMSHAIGQRRVGSRNGLDASPGFRKVCWSRYAPLGVS